MQNISSVLPSLISVPDKFAPTLPDRGWVVPIMHELNPWWTILVAIVPAILGRLSAQTSFQHFRTKKDWHHRVYRVPGFLFSRPNWVPSSPLSECVSPHPPLGSWGGVTHACGVGSGGTQFRRRDRHYNPSATGICILSIFLKIILIL
jgi:hypothetical protein